MMKNVSTSKIFGNWDQTRKKKNSLPEIQSKMHRFNLNSNCLHKMSLLTKIDNK